MLNVLLVKILNCREGFLLRDSELLQLASSQLDAHLAGLSLSSCVLYSGRDELKKVHKAKLFSNDF